MWNLSPSLSYTHTLIISLSLFIPSSISFFVCLTNILLNSLSFTTHTHTPLSSHSLFHTQAHSFAFFLNQQLTKLATKAKLPSFYWKHFFHHFSMRTKGGYFSFGDMGFSSQSCLPHFSNALKVWIYGSSPFRDEKGVFLNCLTFYRFVR